MEGVLRTRIQKVPRFHKNNFNDFKDLKELRILKDFMVSRVFKISRFPIKNSKVSKSSKDSKKLKDSEHFEAQKRYCVLPTLPQIKQGCFSPIHSDSQTTIVLTLLKKSCFLTTRKGSRPRLSLSCIDSMTNLRLTGTSTLDFLKARIIWNQHINGPFPHDIPFP